MSSSRASAKTTRPAVQAKTEYERIPRRTVKQDPEKYTKNPHAYGDVLIRGGKLGGPLQRDLFYWICRYTWGDPKRPEYVKLSITKLAQLCQSWDADKQKLRPAERKSVAVALADLERRRIIEARDRKGCGPTTAKMYKPTPEHWRDAKPYEPPTRTEIEEAEASIDPEDEETPVIPEAALPQSIVRDGKLSRPQPVSVRPARGADPVTIRLVYNPTGFDFPVMFRCRPGANGRIQVTAAPHRTGETKANNCSRAQLQFAKNTADSKRFTDFDTCINEISRQVWGIALTDDKIHDILAAIPTAPVELFAAIARRKLAGRDAGHKHSPRLLVNLAAEAERSYAKERVLEARQRAAEHRTAISPVSASPELTAFVDEHNRKAAELLAQQEAERLKGGK